MKIHKFEQSGFIIESENGFKLALDIGCKTPVEKLQKIQADAFLVSHVHADHLSYEHIFALSPKDVYLNKECIDALDSKEGLSVTQIRSGEVFNIDSIEIEPFNVDHGPNVSTVPKENFGFIISVDGQKIYFAGDMFYESGIDVTDLEINIALIPVGTFYTFGPKEAYDFIKKFKKIDKVVPMHYEKAPETPNEFIRIIKDDFVVEKM